MRLTPVEVTKAKSGGAEVERWRVWKFVGVEIRTEVGCDHEARQPANSSVGQDTRYSARTIRASPPTAAELEPERLSHATGSMGIRLWPSYLEAMMGIRWWESYRDLRVCRERFA
jgi:hypothetical protein